MSDAVPQPRANSYAWGRLSALGLSVAALTCLVDQALKFWLLFDFDLASRGRFAVMPFFDLLLTWNTGISYGLFPRQGPVGEWILLDAESWIGPDGAGLAMARLADQRGTFGHAVQSLVIEKR